MTITLETIKKELKPEDIAIFSEIIKLENSILDVYEYALDFANKNIQANGMTRNDHPCNCSPWNVFCIIGCIGVTKP